MAPYTLLRCPFSRYRPDRGDEMWEAEDSYGHLATIPVGVTWVLQ